jgi:hypothetical protein
MQFSDHLLPALRAAGALEVEMACEGDWEEDSQLERVRAAVHAVDALDAGTGTREQVAALAARAAAMQGDAMQSEAETEAASLPVTVNAAWPVTIEAADVLRERACLTSELIALRDTCGGKPPQGGRCDPG